MKMKMKMKVFFPLFSLALMTSSAFAMEQEPGLEEGNSLSQSINASHASNDESIFSDDNQPINFTFSKLHNTLLESPDTKTRAYNLAAYVFECCVADMRSVFGYSTEQFLEKYEEYSNRPIFQQIMDFPVIFPEQLTNKILDHDVWGESGLSAVIEFNNLRGAMEQCFQTFSKPLDLIEKITIEKDEEIAKLNGQVLEKEVSVELLYKARVDHIRQISELNGQVLEKESANAELLNEIDVLFKTIENHATQMSEKLSQIEQAQKTIAELVEKNTEQLSQLEAIQKAFEEAQAISQLYETKNKSMSDAMANAIEALKNGSVD